MTDQDLAACAVAANRIELAARRHEGAAAGEQAQLRAITRTAGTLRSMVEALIVDRATRATRAVAQ